jgi:hypothetical protein
MTYHSRRASAPASGSQAYTGHSPLFDERSVGADAFHDVDAARRGVLDEHQSNSLALIDSHERVPGTVQRPPFPSGPTRSSRRWTGHAHAVGTETGRRTINLELLQHCESTRIERVATELGTRKPRAID